jgi:DNA-binding transcriptional LysR family regulator
LEYRQIRYALAVAKERSFTKAAERLNISQSAVSEQVKLLEEEAGFPLFRRTLRGIDVTERGRTFLYEAERIVGDVLSLSDTARRLRGVILDTLTIGMGSGMAQIFMPRLFKNLQETLPGARLEILTAPTKNIFNDLHEERIDVGADAGEQRRAADDARRGKGRLNCGGRGIKVRPSPKITFILQRCISVLPSS